MSRVVSIALLAALGCHPKPSGVPPLCSFDMASEGELASKALPPATWLRLVSPSVDKTTMVRSGPLKDSCGRVVEDVANDPTFTCPAARFETVVVADDRVEASDLIMSQVGAGRVVLWAATDELVDGQAFGSIALAQWTERGIEIHGAGVVRGYRQGARMRLHHASGIPVLVLESDRCDRANACTRVGQFVPMLARRFREVPLFEGERGCIGRAQFALTRQTEVKLDSRWVRRFRMSRNIELADSGIVLTDLVIVEDFDSGDPSTPPTPFRRATASRPLELADGRFELRDEDLWERVLRDYGEVRGPTPRVALQHEDGLSRSCRCGHVTGRMKWRADASPASPQRPKARCPPASPRALRLEHSFGPHPTTASTGRDRQGASWSGC